jgi:hypothetical protein
MGELAVTIRTYDVVVNIRETTWSSDQFIQEESYVASANIASQSKVWL